MARAKKRRPFTTAKSPTAADLIEVASGKGSARDKAEAAKGTSRRKRRKRS